MGFWVGFVPAAVHIFSFIGTTNANRRERIDTCGHMLHLGFMGAASNKLLARLTATVLVNCLHFY